MSGCLSVLAWWLAGWLADQEGVVRTFIVNHLVGSNAFQYKAGQLSSVYSVFCEVFCVFTVSNVWFNIVLLRKVTFWGHIEQSYKQLTVNRE